MTTILHAIQSAATDTVEAAGMHWKVGKVNSAALASVGFAALAMSSAAQAGGQDDQPTPEELVSRISPKQAEQLAGLQDATVAAGLTAVSEDGEQWEPLQAVIDPHREDADAGVLCVNSLPAGVVTACFTAIMALSTDDGRAAERLRSFREPAGHAAGDLDAGHEDRPLAPRSAGA
jgi:hypothetical protein